MVKNLLLTIIIFLFFGLYANAQFTSVSFSVQAHQDDWQLFMSAKIVSDLNISGRKMVFITLTDGDGSVVGAYGPSGVPFYIARENGAVYSSKYVADLTTITTPLDAPTATTVSITGNTAHNITKYVYKNTVNYFLRLPDGNGDGNGFSSTGNVSLEKLKAGSISSISALGSVAATYTGWSDLTNTIKAIINTEKVTGTQSWIYTAHTFDGTNTAFNSQDHSDHRYSSLAAQVAVTSGMAWVGVVGFMDYASTYVGPISATTDHENASALFALAVWGHIEAAYTSNFNSSHLGWVPFDYFQIIRNPTGNAPFAGTPVDGDPEQMKNGITDNKRNSISHLTEIPIIVSITSPVFIDKDISMIISPYEPGQLQTTIYDLAGNNVYELKTTVTKRDALFITLQKAIKIKGTYIIKNILNNKFIETRKIVVE